MTTFPKREHIVSTRLIDLLFGSGSKALVAYPLRVVYRLVPRQQTGVEAQMLISVPKKRFKHAVDRNHVKRLTREAYRTQKLPLHAALEKTGQTIEVAFLYVDNKFITFEQTYKLMGKAIGKLQHAILEAAKNQPS